MAGSMRPSLTRLPRVSQGWFCAASIPDRAADVPPPLIGHTSKASSWASSLENLNLHFLLYSLQPTLVRCEQRIEKKLLSFEDIAAGYPYLTGDLAAETQDVSALFGGKNLALAARRQLSDWTVPVAPGAVENDFVSYGSAQDWLRQAELNKDYLVRRAQRLNAGVPDR